MIKLTKGQKPQVLLDHEAEWTAVLVKKAAAGEKPSDTEASRYRHAEIKTALKIETNGKCAYCESKLLHIAYGDVEHIHPKKKDLNLILKWENLTLACDICNTNKGEYNNIVDPYTCDPQTRFNICGPLILAKSGDDEALVTQRRLDLNRGGLVEQRQRRIMYLHSLLNTLQKTSDSDHRQILMEDYLRNEAHDGVEYAAMSRWFLDVAQSEMSV